MTSYLVRIVLVSDGRDGRISRYLVLRGSHGGRQKERVLVGWRHLSQRYYMRFDIKRYFCNHLARPGTPSTIIDAIAAMRKS